MTTIATKSVNKTLLTSELEVISAFERKIASIYERGGLSALKGRQLFVNEATNKLQLRMQHIQMLHRDNNVLSSKGALVYGIKTIKTTDLKSFNTNESQLKKMFFVKTDKSNGSLALRDFHITSSTNVVENIAESVNFSLPSFVDIQSQINQLLIDKKINKIQALFSLDYFCYLSKCLGKQPRFALSQEESLLVLSKASNPEWIQNCFDLTWLIVDPSFKN